MKNPTARQQARLLDSDDYTDLEEPLLVLRLASGPGTFVLSPLATSGKAGSTFTICANGIGDYDIVNIEATARAMRLMIRFPLLGPHLAAVLVADATITVTDISSLNEVTTDLNLPVMILTGGPSVAGKRRVSEISSVINESEFWDEEILVDCAIGYAQVGTNLMNAR